MKLEKHLHSARSEEGRLYYDRQVFTETDSDMKHKWLIKEEFPGETYKGVKKAEHRKEKQ